MSIDDDNREGIEDAIIVEEDAAGGDHDGPAARQGSHEAPSGVRAARTRSSAGSSDETSRGGGILKRLRRRVDGIRSPGSSRLEAPSRAGERLKRLGGRALALAPGDTVKRSLEATLKAATDPRAVQALRTGLTTLGNASMAVIFRGEPEARRLFELADWCGERCGRGIIMGILLQDALSPQGAFFQIAGPLVQFAPDRRSVQIQWASVGAQWPQMREALDRAQLGALKTLSAMVAAATETPAPAQDADKEALAAFIHAAEIPERFKSLPDKIMGRAAAAPHPSSRSAANARTEHRRPTEDHQSGDLKRGEASAEAEAVAPWRSALPALSLSPGHRFVLGPYLLFLQTMLTRNMVDALPTMAEKIRDELTPHSPSSDTATSTPPDIVVTKQGDS